MRERSKRMGKAVADPGNEQPASPLRWETALKDQVERVPTWRRAWPTPWHAGPALPLPRRPPRRPLSARAHHAPRRSPDVWGPGREAVRDLSHVADGSKAIAPQIMQPVSLVLVAKAEIDNLRGFALLRGWDRRRLLSSSVPTFNRDVGMVGEHGSEKPDRSVFARIEHVVVSHRSTIGAKFDEHTTSGIDPCTGYVSRVTHDEIADAVG